MYKTWSERAWEHYLYWQANDKSVLRKINELLKDIERNGLANGIGKPELLKNRAVWSRRINHEHRLLYKLDEQQHLVIVTCKGHYDD